MGNSLGKSFRPFADSRDWAIQISRIVAEAQYGAADFFEIVRTVDRIEPGNAGSWSEEWEETATKAEKRANDAAGFGRIRTARTAFFHSSSYYRMSEMFVDPSERRKLELYKRGIAAFHQAVELSSGTLERVRIPFEGAELPGYFCRAAGGAQGPAVLYLGGADSWAEELYFLGGTEIVARGMHLLIVDTPGRGGALRLSGLRSRYDYEVPVSEALDYLCNREEVDPTRVALAGDSMGGYYAPRAAAFDDRVQACVAWAGCFDVLRDIYENYPPIQRQFQWILGAESDEEAREALARFNLQGVANKITCPLLVVHGAQDFIMSPRGARDLFDSASGPKELLMWGEKDRPGGMHLSYDDMAVVLPTMFDWLSSQLTVSSHRRGKEIEV